MVIGELQSVRLRLTQHNTFLLYRILCFVAQSTTPEVQPRLRAPPNPLVRWSYLVLWSAGELNDAVSTKKRSVLPPTAPKKLGLVFNAMLELPSSRSCIVLAVDLHKDHEDSCVGCSGCNHLKWSVDSCCRHDDDENADEPCYDLEPVFTL
jgi:hypothetical protein